MEREIRIQKWRAPKYPTAEHRSHADLNLRKAMKKKSRKARRQLEQKPND